MITVAAGLVNVDPGDMLPKNIEFAENDINRSRRLIILSSRDEPSGGIPKLWLDKICIAYDRQGRDRLRPSPITQRDPSLLASTKFMAILNNAYGHGMLEVAHTRETGAITRSGLLMRPFSRETALPPRCLYRVAPRHRPWMKW